MLPVYLRKIVITIVFVAMLCQPAIAENIATNTFKTIFKFAIGSNQQELKWLRTETGGVIDGPFQGPMAFVTDKNGNLWIGDTLNNKIKAYDKKGKIRKEINLSSYTQKLKLASEPILLDFIPGINGTLLVADVANNAVLKISIKDSSADVYRSSPSGQGFWQQINKIHCDKKGRIYVEDLPSMRTVVLKPNGKPKSEALQGEVGIAVNELGKTAMVVMDHANLNIRHIVVSPQAGSPPEKIASLMLEEIIDWSSVIGFDEKNNIHVILDTKSLRHYYSVSIEGKVLTHKIAAFPDPNYDPNRPDWIGPDGAIYTVKIEGDFLKIMRLE